MDSNNGMSSTSLTNDIIDLTVPFEFPTVNWPTEIIELNESVTATPPRRCRRNSQTNRNRTRSQDNSDIVVIEDSPAPPLTRPRNVATRNIDLTRSENNDNSQQRQQLETSYSERRDWFFGDCPICFDPLGKNPLASTKCGHVFCLKCLQLSVKYIKVCPNCRTPLYGKNSYHPLYFSKDFNPGTG